MTVCVTGHRSKGFPFLRDRQDASYLAYCARLREEIEQCIEDGYTVFLTGMAEGADLDFASCVASLIEEGKNITLHAALPTPCTEQEHRKEHTQLRDSLLSRCSDIHIVSPHYHAGCMHKRNLYMVEKADLVLAIWNGEEQGGTWHTIQAARKKQKPIRYILLSEIKTG